MKLKPGPNWTDKLKNETEWNRPNVFRYQCVKRQVRVFKTGPSRSLNSGLRKGEGGVKGYIPLIIFENIENIY